MPGVSALATGWLEAKVYPGLGSQDAMRYEDYLSIYIELAAWSGTGGISYYE